MFSKTLKKMSEILTEIRDSHKCDCFALENDRDPMDYPFYSKHSHNMWLYAYTRYLVEYSTHTYSEYIRIFLLYKLEAHFRLERAETSSNTTGQ